MVTVSLLLFVPTMSTKWLFLLLFCPFFLGVFFKCLVTLVIQSNELTRFFPGPMTFPLGWSDTQEKVPLLPLAASRKDRWEKARVGS